MASVSVSALRKSFGRTVVLDDVSVEVPDGAFAVLVGPSGCGKSTLLRLLAGLESADAGTICFGERDVTGLEPRERDIAMVFQSYALYPHLSVRDNLAFGLRLRKTAKAEIDERVAEVAQMLGLDKLLQRMPSQLSGGQRQRVAMGRAVVRRPQVFLFDEPLSNLDASLRSQVRVEIRKLHADLGTTSVYVTHDQVEAMTLADVMFVLNDGRVEQAGAPLELYGRPASRFVASFLGSPAMNFFDGVIEDGAVSVGSLRLPIARGAFAVDEGDPVSVGVRPHDLVPCEETAVGAFVIEVTLAEALGGETYVHGALGGQDVVARTEPSHVVKAGESFWFRVAADQLHLFAPETGKSLRC